MHCGTCSCRLVYITGWSCGRY